MACGDVLLAFEGRRLDAEGLERLLQIDGERAPMTVHGFRDDRLMHYTLSLDAAPKDTCWLELHSDGAAPTRSGLDWLGSGRG
jgi:predicted metalloprotease with PDZ domain